MPAIMPPCQTDTSWHERSIAPKATAHEKTDAATAPRGTMRHLMSTTLAHTSTRASAAPANSAHRQGKTARGMSNKTFMLSSLADRPGRVLRNPSASSGRVLRDPSAQSGILQRSLRYPSTPPPVRFLPHPVARPVRHVSAQTRRPPRPNLGSEPAHRPLATGRFPKRNRNMVAATAQNGET